MTSRQPDTDRQSMSDTAIRRILTLFRHRCKSNTATVGDSPIYTHRNIFELSQGTGWNSIVFAVANKNRKPMNNAREDLSLSKPAPIAARGKNGPHNCHHIHIQPVIPPELVYPISHEKKCEFPIPPATNRMKRSEETTAAGMPKSANIFHRGRFEKSRTALHTVMTMNVCM